MEFDFIDETDKPAFYRLVKGVKSIPMNRDGKPYHREQAIGNYKNRSNRSVANLYSRHHLSDEARINNHHTRRVRGKVSGYQHFTEALVEFSGLKRQLWSILHQGLRTITRRRGGFHFRDLVSRGTWKQAPEIYLLWQFALAPIISQINDTLEKMAKVSVEIYDRVHTSGDLSPSRAGSSSYIVTGDSVSYTTVFRYIVNNNLKESILEFLGVNRPLTVLWDLKGYSWAVDYFFNVGELISNFDGEPLTRSVTWISHSVKKKGQVIYYKDIKPTIKVGSYAYDYNPTLGYQVVATYPDGYVDMALGPRIGLIECLNFQRSIGGFPNSFLPEFKFKPAFGTFQFANLASAIALSLKSYEVDPHLLQPFKKGKTPDFNPRRL